LKAICLNKPRRRKAPPMSVTKRSDKFEDVAHAGFFVSIEDSSEVPKEWRLRSEGSWTSHNGSSENFLGNGSRSAARRSRMEGVSGAGSQLTTDRASEMLSAPAEVQAPV